MYFVQNSNCDYEQIALFFHIEQRCQTLMLIEIVFYQLSHSHIH